MKKKKISRRDFVLSSAAAGVAAAAPTTAFGAAPTMIVQNKVKPLVIASGNGTPSHTVGRKPASRPPFDLMTGGKDVLESLIAGVNIVELDPADSGVGYGGRPNADGVVQLDSCCMHGPKKRAGGVGALEGVRTPSKVAHAVMEYTDHHLLVGDGAQQFARNMGFEIEDDLNSERSRKMWLEWKRRVDPEHYLDPEKRVDAGMAAGRQMLAEGLVDEESFWGTINCDGINADGDICGVTTTSGLAWKIPGRVGDSPILGAGLWVDNEVGAAGSTAAVKRTCTGCARSSSSKRCAAEPTPRRGDGSAPAGQRSDHRQAIVEQPRASELRLELLHPQQEGRARRRLDVRQPSARASPSAPRTPRVGSTRALLGGSVDGLTRCQSAAAGSWQLIKE